MQFLKSEYVETPHGNNSVWKYMNHWKFEKLLSDSALFFPNVTMLTDEYEVTIPEIVLATKRRTLQAQGLSGRDLEEELAAFYFQTNPMKNLTLVNCWSMSPHESYALWKIYLGGEKDGVAIRSTVARLRKAVQSGGDSYPEEFYIGKVRYRSHLRQDEIARLSIITTKKPFYDFEKELRVFIINYPISEGGYHPPYKISSGRNVRVNLDTLIHEVYVSPFSNTGYFQRVEDVVKRNGAKKNNISISQSEIRDK